MMLFLASCQQEEPSGVEQTLAGVRTAIEERRADDALAAMRDLIERRPDDPRIQRIYGETLIATGQPSLAIWPLSSAMESPEEEVAAGLLLVGAQLQSGVGEDAIRTATRVIEAAPDNGYAYYLRARAHLAENREEEALADLERAAEAGYDHERFDYLRLYALLGLERVEESEALLEQLHAEAVEEIAEQPARAAELCAVTAVFAQEKGDPELAEARFEECLDGEGLESPTLVERALRFYDGRGEPERALDLLRRRHEARPEHLTNRVAYATRLRAAGRGDEAEAVLQEATARQPAAWSALVDHHIAEEDFPRAIEALERAMETTPYTPDAWRLSLADMKIIVGDLEGAEAVLEEIELEVHRTVVEGRLLLARDRLPEAAQRFEAAIVSWPDNADLRYLAGHTYERLGQWPRAAAHFREAARVDPPHYLSSRALADLMRALGDDEGQGFVLFRLLKSHPNDPEVLEAAIDYARDVAESLGSFQELFLRLSRMPGMQGRAVANVARHAARSQGVEAGLRTLESSGLDLALPAAYDALALRVRYLRELGRSEEALEPVERALERLRETDDDDDDDARRRAALLVLRGRIALDLGRLDRAASNFEQARALAPEAPESVTGLARVEEARGRVDAARSLHAEARRLEEALRPGSHAYASARAAAELELRAGRTAAGRRILRAVLAAQPRNGEAALMLARSLDEESEQVDDRAPRDALLDAVRRAALFERSAEARALARKHLGADGRAAPEHAGG